MNPNSAEEPPTLAVADPASDPQIVAASQVRRLRELEALYSISSAIHASLDLDQVLHLALGKVLELFELSAGVLRLVDVAAGQLLLTAHSGFPPELMEELIRPVQIGEGVGGLAIRHRSLAVIEDLPESVYADSPWGRCGLRTLVAVPIQSSGMLLGCLNIASDRVRPFSPADRELLIALSNEIGMALANAELYAGAQRKIRQLSALHQCSRDIGPNPELPQVLRVVTERMTQLLQLERAAVLFQLPETQELAGVAACGFPDEEFRTLRVPLVTLPAAESVLRERRACLSSDPAGDGLLPPELAARMGAGAALAVPLIIDEEVLGLLVGDRGSRPLRISSDEMDMAMIFANQAAVWIARARTLTQVRAAQARFQDLLELAPDAIVLTDRDGRIGLVNGQAERMFRYGREELVGQPVETLIPERCRERHLAHRAGYQSDPRTRPMGAGQDLFARRADGSEFPVEISLSPFSTEEGPSVIAIVRDASGRKQAEAERTRLLASEREKGEQLKLAIREAHHRIKNNLQAISDLLYLEMFSGENARAEDVLRESVERVQSIALVHDLLSQDEDVQTVDIRALAKRLVPMVLQGGCQSAQSIDTQLQVPSIALSSKKAATLALILNELVSNAVKHAFAGRPAGRLQVRLSQAEEGLLLHVEDDGPGLPAEFDLNRDASVGMQVVRTLAERDLAGKLRFSDGPGLAVEVWFPW